MPRPITFDTNRLVAVTASDDAVANYFASTSEVGIFKDVKAECQFNVINSSFIISSGFVRIYGRDIEILENEEVTPVFDNLGDKFVILVLKVDLLALGLNQVIWEFKYFDYNNVSIVSLTQENLCQGGIIYEFPLASFKLTLSGITEINDMRKFIQSLPFELSQKQSLFDIRPPLKIGKNSSFPNPLLVFDPEIIFDGYSNSISPPEMIDYNKYDLLYAEFEIPNKTYPEKNSGVFSRGGNYVVTTINNSNGFHYGKINFSAGQIIATNVYITVIYGLSRGIFAG